MRTRAPVRTAAMRPNMLLVWLAIGLVFHLLYFGLPHPFSLHTWLHVLFWPVYVLLGLVRWIFFPFAILAMLCFAMMFAFNFRR
jgi:hypothetical protein